MKKFLFILAFVGFCFATGPNTNWNGLGDTSSIDSLMADSLKYSRVFELSKHEDIAVIVKCDDTTSALFASDSIQVEYGYEVGYIVYNSSGAKDTAWSPKIVLDTIKNDSLGKMRGGFVLPDGTDTTYLGSLDTSNVSGFANQISWFVPRWGILIRYFAQGLAGNNADNPLLWVFDHKRRLFVGTRQK